MSWLLSALGGVWGKVMAAGAVLLGILAAVAGLQRSAKKAGANEVKAAQAEKGIEDAKRAQEIETRNESSGADDRRRRLREHYTGKD